MQCDEYGSAGGRCFLDDGCPMRSSCGWLVAEKFRGAGVQLSYPVLEARPVWSPPSAAELGAVPVEGALDGTAADGEFGGRLAGPDEQDWLSPEDAVYDEEQDGGYWPGSVLDPAAWGLPAFSPRTEIRHRCKVYRFGASWHWKCYEPRCRGGKAASLVTAFGRALAHCEAQGQED